MQLSNYKQCLVGTVQLYNSKLKEHIGGNVCQEQDFLRRCAAS